ncbi:hypothetical protein [Bifidobacterium psychraerophilum]|uniref:hypothetical protein n=1 Tax=Bifidobacterium psychraerophilum TaxID=218140 RepID=UPI0039EBCBD3
MKRSQRTVVYAVLAIVGGVYRAMSGRAQEERRGTTSDQGSTSSRLQTVSYEITYQGRRYTKNASVYVPDSYREGIPMNILYLMHGSQSNGPELARDMHSDMDGGLADKPMLVVFPTYYPDDTFSVPDYTEDYPLNRFFAVDEIELLMRAVEGRFTTYAEGVTDADFENSRDHRAFGGYSMGGVTTWEMLAAKPQYFHDFMPMAGDSWINRRRGGNTDEETAASLIAGMEERGYGSRDVTIVAMVGEGDGTKSSMPPPRLSPYADSTATL